MMKNGDRLYKIVPATMLMLARLGLRDFTQTVPAEKPDCTICRPLHSTSLQSRPPNRSAGWLFRYVLFRVQQTAQTGH
jgi:hypothetical protein